MHSTGLARCKRWAAARESRTSGSAHLQGRSATVAENWGTIEFKKTKSRWWLLYTLMYFGDTPTVHQRRKSRTWAGRMGCYRFDSSPGKKWRWRWTKTLVQHPSVHPKTLYIIYIYIYIYWFMDVFIHVMFPKNMVLAVGFWVTHPMVPVAFDMVQPCHRRTAAAEAARHGGFRGSISWKLWFGRWWLFVKWWHMDVVMDILSIWFWLILVNHLMFYGPKWGSGGGFGDIDSKKFSWKTFWFLPRWVSCNNSLPGAGELVAVAPGYDLKPFWSVDESA